MERHIWTVFLGLSLIYGGILTEGSGENHMYDLPSLRKNVLAGYDAYVRPLCDRNEPTNITVDMGLRQIISLDEPTQQLRVNVWMRLFWSDCHLTWNASEYGVSRFKLPYKDIWVPDITLYDSTTGDGFPGLHDYVAEVYHDGQIRYSFPTVLESFCKLDVTYFPYDTQTCQFVFSSWAYDGSGIDLYSKSQTDLQNYQENVGWKVLDFEVERHEVVYTCCPDPYVDVTFYLHLQRRPMNFIVSLVFPCVLICCLTLLGFLLPVESGEKVSLQLTVMLSLAVFLLVISDSLPPSSDSVPLLGVYFAMTLALVAISCVITVGVIHLHFKDSNPVPRWMKSVIINGIGKLLLVDGVEMNPEVYNEDNKQLHGNGVPVCTKNKPIADDSQNDACASICAAKMDELLAIQRKIADHYQQQKRGDTISSEWRALAIVVDRIFFIICLTFLVVATAYIFYNMSMARA